jgi:hypothetical protein
MDTQIGHERLFMRLFAILIGIDRILLKSILRTFFPNISRNILNATGDLEIWFDKHLMSDLNYPQPDIIITNRDFWVKEKRTCYLIEIKRGSPLPSHQITRYENALRKFREANSHFEGGLSVLVDNETNKRRTPYERVFTYRDREAPLKKRRREISRNNDRGMLNTPAA